MNHLEELSLIHQLISSDELARVFASCPKISRLCVSLALNPLIQDNVRMNQLRSGFQRLKFLKLYELSLSIESITIVLVLVIL